jgi:hypothetical protein
MCCRLASASVVAAGAVAAEEGEAPLAPADDPPHAVSAAAKMKGVVLQGRIVTFYLAGLQGCF